MKNITRLGRYVSVGQVLERYDATILGPILYGTNTRDDMIQPYWDRYYMGPIRYRRDRYDMGGTDTVSE